MSEPLIKRIDRMPECRLPGISCPFIAQCRASSCAEVRSHVDTERSSTQISSTLTPIIGQEDE